MQKRKIINIDQDKCNGCGLCIPNCREGAIQLIDGKARLIGDSLCDGLGACLGHCPQGAITIEERQAEEYCQEKGLNNPLVKQNTPVSHGREIHSGCPGAKIMDFRGGHEQNAKNESVVKSESELRQWPIQLMLVPAFAPFLENADLLIAADCVPFAYPEFHRGLLRDKILLTGCPKFDDLNLYREKISQILEHNQIRSITYARMEVPCCSGLTNIIQSAIKGAGKNTPFSEAVISIKGERLA